MATKTINSALLARMFLAGANNIEAQKAYINELNVFPVPDGDTGTNMSLTIMSAAKEVMALPAPGMKELAKAISSGSLRGARGNSGVILSQLLRGFTKTIREETEIDAMTLAVACAKARDTAYKAVMKPKEGTILTVASGIAEKAAEMVETTDDLEIIIPEVLDHARAVLAQTPELLPVLKEAGVVDSGGQGLVEIISGAYDAFLGKEIDYSRLAGEANTPQPAVRSEAAAPVRIKFGYCTEFIIDLTKTFTKNDEKEFTDYLTAIGDSIVCVADTDMVKIHVHTNDPGLALQKGLTYGALTRIKIDNMREEQQEKLAREAQDQTSPADRPQSAPESEEPGPRKEVGFVAVSIGRGMNDIFRELGVDYIIEGGQTMNPSTEDMLKAIAAINAETVFILPNNKNIILAATQAAALTKDKHIVVIPTKTVPQGITAVISYSSGMDAKASEELMLEEISNVKTAQVTYAVRDTHIDGKEIMEGDIMGIGDAGIVAVGKNIAETAKETLDQLIDEEAELVSIYYGEEVASEEAESFLAQIEAAHPNLDIDLQYGGQPIYYYVMSVE